MYVGSFLVKMRSVGGRNKQKQVITMTNYRNQPTSVGSQRLPTRELVAFTIRHAFFQ